MTLAEERCQCGNAPRSEHIFLVMFSAHFSSDPISKSAMDGTFCSLIFNLQEPFPEIAKCSSHILYRRLNKIQIHYLYRP